MNKIKELDNINFRLIYAFYLDNESISLNDHISYKVNLKCLEYILNKQNIAQQFNEIYFIIHTLNLNNPLIKTLKYKLVNITNNCKHVYFIIEKNIPQYREGIIFKKYILEKLNDYDGLTLFFHNKGFHQRYLKNDGAYPYYWIISLYFFNMYINNFYEYFSKFIYNDNKLIWGYPLIYLTNSTKFTYHIAGACYWMKCNEIYKYLNDNDYKINKDNENLQLSIFNCAELFFPHTLNLNNFDYYESDILKNEFNDYIYNYWLKNTNNDIKEYFEHTLPYKGCKMFFNFYDYIMKDIENYKI